MKFFSLKSRFTLKTHFKYKKEEVGENFCDVNFHLVRLNAGTGRYKIIGMVIVIGRCCLIKVLGANCTFA